MDAQKVVSLAEIPNVFPKQRHAIVMTIVGMAVMKRRDARVNFGYLYNF